jgi:hypothetical protein
MRRDIRFKFFVDAERLYCIGKLEGQIPTYLNVKAAEARLDQLCMCRIQRLFTTLTAVESKRSACIQYVLNNMSPLHNNINMYIP